MPFTGKQIREFDKVLSSIDTDYYILQRVNSDESIGTTYKISFSNLLKFTIDKDFSHYNSSPNLIITDTLLINRVNTTTNVNELFNINSNNLINFILDLSLSLYKERTDTLKDTDWFYVYDAELSNSNKYTKINYIKLQQVINSNLPIKRIKINLTGGVTSNNTVFTELTDQTTINIQTNVISSEHNHDTVYSKIGHTQLLSSITDYKEPTLIAGTGISITNVNKNDWTITNSNNNPCDILVAGKGLSIDKLTTGTNSVQWTINNNSSLLDLILTAGSGIVINKVNDTTWEIINNITAITGQSGVQGIQGIIGPQGIQGLKGDVGDIGPQGIQGIQGIIGPQGIQGLKGDVGDIGPQGIQGIQGLKGDVGNVGSQGYAGLEGSKGIQGLKGDTGDTGPQGIQGLKGDTGDTGSQGIQGFNGLEGPIGIQGPQGIEGASSIIQPFLTNIPLSLTINKTLYPILSYNYLINVNYTTTAKQTLLLPYTTLYSIKEEILKGRTQEIIIPMTLSIVYEQSVFNTITYDCIVMVTSTLISSSSFTPSTVSLSLSCSANQVTSYTTGNLSGSMTTTICQNALWTVIGNDNSVTITLVCDNDDAEYRHQVISWVSVQ